jgi:hypothetical protein
LVQQVGEHCFTGQDGASQDEALGWEASQVIDIVKLSIGNFADRRDVLHVRCYRQAGPGATEDYTEISITYEFVVLF